MPLNPPLLDSRTYETLRTQALLRAVQYTPEWTDHNPSDPGVTLLELFAWYTELLFCELNRVPELNYIKFLDLLGLRPADPIPAAADVTFTSVPGAVAAVIPAGSQVTGDNPSGGPAIIFQTGEDLELGGLPLTAVQVFDGDQNLDYTEANTDGTTTYPPFGWRATGGCYLLLGFSATKGTPVRPFPRRISIRVFMAPTRKQAAVPVDSTALRAPTSPVALQWGYRPDAESGRWRALDVIRDDTAGFTQDGYIIIAGPPDAAATTEGIFKDGERFWLRCAIVDRTPGYVTPPEVDLICPNTVRARNLVAAQPELLGPAQGVPGESFTLRFTPVVRDSVDVNVDVDVNTDAEATRWTCVEDFLASGPSCAVYTVDATSGKLSFGDGINGRLLPHGATITVSYSYTAGAAGNLAAGAIKGIPTRAVNGQPPVMGVTSVTNPRPAVGGADEQSVDDLCRQAPAMVRTVGRAVTSEDFVSLATRVGGVARATAVPLHHPEHPAVPVPGAVTIVIVPSNVQSAAPRPSTDLSRAVAAELEELRLITTELFVTGPDYQAVSVTASVIVTPGHAPEAVIAAVGDAIDAFLHPLIGGLDKAGWPFGRDLIPTNLYAVMSKVDGVTGVTALAVAVDGRDHPLGQPVKVTSTGLLHGGTHVIQAVEQG